MFLIDNNFLKPNIAKIEYFNKNILSLKNFFL